MSASLLKVTDLKKAYGAIQAVGGVSFEVMPGEIFGVIGPNGKAQQCVVANVDAQTFSPNRVVAQRGKRLAPRRAQQAPQQS